MSQRENLKISRLSNMLRRSPDEHNLPKAQKDKPKADLNIFPGNWTIKNEMMFRAFDLSFAQNWNPSTLPWDELDGKNFDPKERIAQAYWMSKLALFEKSGIGAFGFGIVRAAIFNSMRQTSKLQVYRQSFQNITRDETRHLVATMALLRAMSQEFTEEQKLTVTRQMKQGFIFLSPLLYEHKSEFWRLPSDFDKVDHELEQ